MYNLFIINEIFTNGYRIEILDVLFLLCIICGILVIINKNPIVSVLFLIGLFLSIASYLIILGLNFIGLSYILVYVGAVSILFLFILMLLNIRISELLSNTTISIPLAIIVSISFNYPIYQILPYSIIVFNENIMNLNNVYNDMLYYSYNYKYLYSKYIKEIEFNHNKMFFVTTKTWDSNLFESSNIISIGNIIYTNYCIWLILTSIILLLAMVGAIIITIKENNNIY